jgi:hypothetical protein
MTRVGKGEPLERKVGYTDTSPFSTDAEFPQNGVSVTCPSELQFELKLVTDRTLPAITYKRGNVLSV